MRRWKVIKRGEVPAAAWEIEYTCSGCQRDAMLPVVGRAIAQTGDGIIFDGHGALPTEIKCPYCQRLFTTEGEVDVREAI